MKRFVFIVIFSLSAVATWCKTPFSFTSEAGLLKSFWDYPVTAMFMGTSVPGCIAYVGDDFMAFETKVDTLLETRRQKKHGNENITQISDTVKIPVSELKSVFEGLDNNPLAFPKKTDITFSAENFKYVKEKNGLRLDADTVKKIFNELPDSTFRKSLCEYGWSTYGNFFLMQVCNSNKDTLNAVVIINNVWGFAMPWFILYDDVLIKSPNIGLTHFVEKFLPKDFLYREVFMDENFYLMSGYVSSYNNPVYIARISKCRRKSTDVPTSIKVEQRLRYEVARFKHILRYQKEMSKDFFRR